MSIAQLAQRMMKAERNEIKIEASQKRRPQFGTIKGVAIEAKALGYPSVYAMAKDIGLHDTTVERLFSRGGMGYVFRAAKAAKVARELGYRSAGDMMKAVYGAASIDQIYNSDENTEAFFNLARDRSKVDKLAMFDDYGVTTFDELAARFGCHPSTIRTAYNYGGRSKADRVIGLCLLARKAGFNTLTEAYKSGGAINRFTSCKSNDEYNTHVTRFGLQHRIDVVEFLLPNEGFGHARIKADRSRGMASR